jgi:Zn-dependent protease with chaperone function
MYKQSMESGSPSGHGLRLEDLFQTRRQFLGRLGLGMGALSLATLLENQAGQAAEAEADAGGAVSAHPLAP